MFTDENDSIRALAIANNPQRPILYSIFLLIKNEMMQWIKAGDFVYDYLPVVLARSSISFIHSKIKIKSFLLLLSFLWFNILMEAMPNDACFTTSKSWITVSRHSPNPRMTVRFSPPSSSSQMTQVFPGCSLAPDIASHPQSSVITNHLHHHHQ